MYLGSREKRTQKLNNVNTRNLCVGTGLLALDVLMNGSPKTLPRLHTGGSCGNVLTILSYLGWETYPIARLANNNATLELEADLKKWKVKTDLITRTTDGSTPIIIHRILKDKEGKPKHRFEFRDPDTKEWLPRYKPVLSKDVPAIVEKRDITPNFFYFDRINRASIDLAKHFKAKGTIIYFEPSSIGNKLSLFEECLDVSHIVKFSNERISNYSDLFPEQKVCLEIETLGKDGLRFRYGKLKNSAKWHTLSPYTVNELNDSAGAGDWCSAGLIFKLGNTQFSKLTLSNIKEALSFGQAIAAVNCSFDGARGAMYSLESKQLKKVVSKIIIGNPLDVSSLKKNQLNEGKKIKFSQLF